MSIELLSKFIQENYEIHEWKHATTILHGDFPNEWNDIIQTLTDFRLRKSWITVGGGQKSHIAEWIDDRLIKEKKWEEKAFDTKMLIDNTEYLSPTHKIDCYKNRIALEVEWNNKDPFFDRDLNNFRLLFELRAISVGIIITRTEELQEIFASIGRGQSFGASTTHISKLLPKIQGGGGGGCPILVFGIKKSLYIED
ncbi:MAG TPA: BglII/BstYI family type II restriction endonuclease [bacterium]|nr:BglII/BstYI family type II restriction endonuclease [bacterium]HPN43750.1 BglII/BstYI family type II restriction endonuclease [bacterium]